MEHSQRRRRGESRSREAQIWCIGGADRNDQNSSRRGQRLTVGAAEAVRSEMPARRTCVARQPRPSRPPPRRPRHRGLRGQRRSLGSDAPDVNSVGPPSRIVAASRRMTSSEAPTCGARSVLLMTSRSDCETPGPPLRGTLSALLSTATNSSAHLRPRHRSVESAQPVRRSRTT